MDRPTITEVRARSKLLTARYPEGDGDEGLTALVETASDLVSAITGRDIGVDAGEDVPTNLVGVAKRAVALKAESVEVLDAADVAEEEARGRRLRSIAAGPWSESYFGPGELAGKRGEARPRLDPRDALDEALWLLLTDARREAIMEEFAGQYAPAGAITGFRYGERAGRY